MTPARPAVIVAAPRTSVRPAVGSRVSGTWRRVIQKATAARGTLIRKIHRHDAASTSQPPTNGPSADATPLQPGPGPDRPAPVRRADGRVEQREAAGNQQGATEALEEPRRDQDRTGRGEPAADRRDGERDQPEREDRAASVPVTQGAAEQQQGAEGEEVTVEDPLQGRESAAEIPSDRGQRDVDHRPVEEGDPRTQDRRRDDPATARARRGDAGPDEGLGAAGTRRPACHPQSPW